MKAALEFIINSLIGDESTVIEEEVSPQGTVLVIKPIPENTGKIIGKKGKIINSIRKLLRIRAAKEGTSIHLRIGDEDQLEKGSVLKEELPVATGTPSKGAS